jgi:hypothetical protein
MNIERFLNKANLNCLCLALLVLIYASLQAFRLGICSFVLISLSDNMDRLESMKANGREPKTGFGRVFNFKLGCFDDVCVLVYADACPHL